MLIKLLLFISGVILSEDQPVAPVSSTSSGIKTEISPASKAHAPETVTPAAIPVKPAVADKSEKGKERGGRGRPPLRHRSEGGLVEKDALKKLPHLSLSQYDLLDTDVSFQPWGSENSVLVPEPENPAQGPRREQLHSQSPQGSMSGSCPQCSTVITKPELERGDAAQQVGPPSKQEGDCSGSDVTVTLIDTSQPGDPLSLHEPIKIVITMSSTPNSMTDLESSLHLKVTGTETTSFPSDAEPAAPGGAGPANVEQMRIPVITLELPEDGGEGIVYPEGSGRQRTPGRLGVEAPCTQCPGYESGDGGSATKDCSSSLGDHCEMAPPLVPSVASESEQGREGQANLDPSSCKTSHEKRHARVLSVDSGTDVFLSRSSAEIVNDKEKTMPTSKSDLEAKEGQTPNESNFLEFVSLLESINSSKVVTSSQKSGPAELDRESGLLRGKGSIGLS